jgi:hypothetical protein
MSSSSITLIAKIHKALAEDGHGQPFRPSDTASALESTPSWGIGDSGLQDDGILASVRFIGAIDKSIVLFVRHEEVCHLAFAPENNPLYSSIWQMKRIDFPVCRLSGHCGSEIQAG